ncbi:MAG: NRDE family protein, partial [Moraxellaceae bacterium]|nr:NRDE family protein [Moraxellaceae bacterium]
MCIVAIAWQILDDMPLLLLSNRDEFLHRPTLSAHQWQDKPIFAGRDKQSGGTWLGYHTGLQKRWATVLNFREKNPRTENIISRGKLVTDFLANPNPISPMQYIRQINLTDYAGFNLIIGDDKQAVLVNNRGYPPTVLHSGLHVISNGEPTDAWFKCERLRTRLSQELLPLITQGIA